MNLKQFVENIRRCGSHSWRLTTHGRVCIRSTVDDLMTSYCPVTAACFSQTAHYYCTDQYRGAASEIGLPNVLADRIAEAADDWQERESTASDISNVRALRKVLLDAVGLKEPEEQEVTDEAAA